MVTSDGNQYIEEDILQVKQWWKSGPVTWWPGSSRWTSGLPTWSARESGMCWAYWSWWGATCLTPWVSQKDNGRSLIWVRWLFDGPLYQKGLNLFKVVLCTIMFWEVMPSGMKLGERRMSMSKWIIVVLMEDVHNPPSALMALYLYQWVLQACTDCPLIMESEKRGGGSLAPETDEEGSGDWTVLLTSLSS